MKAHWLMAAAIGAALFGAGGEASAYECKTIKGRCVAEVGGTCERVPGGEAMRYYDRPGNVMAFEQCVARLSAAEGKPNPYAPAQQKAAPKR